MKETLLKEDLDLNIFMGDVGFGDVRFAVVLYSFVMFLGLGECRRFFGGFGVLQFASMQKFIFWVAEMLSQKIWCMKNYNFRQENIAQESAYYYFILCVCVCCRLQSYFFFLAPGRVALQCLNYCR